MDHESDRGAAPDPACDELLDNGEAFSHFGSAPRWVALVRVISKRRLCEHWQMLGRKDSEQPLKTWYNVVENAEWKTHSDVKAAYGANVDLGYGKYVFDIKANHYRLVCLIDFIRHCVLVLWIGTHLEYDGLNRRNGERLKQL